MEPNEIDTIAPDLFEYPVQEEKRRELFRANVKSVIIELFDYCNRQCPYCPVSMVDRLSRKNYMAESHIEQIISDLQAIDYDQSICLNLFNEPLADPITIHTIERLRKALPNASIWFNSNGDYVNRKVLDRLIEVGLSRLVITLHVAKHDTYDDLKQLSRLTQFSARTGIALDIDKFKPNHAIRAKARYKGMPIGVKSANFSHMGYNRGGLLEDIPVPSARETPCDRPFHDLTISWNGDVFPCCHFFADLSDHAPFVVGKIGTAGNLFDLYASRMMASFRADLFTYGPKKSPCDTCTEYDNRRCETDRLARDKAWRGLQNQSDKALA